MSRKKRCSFMIEPELLERLRSIKLRMGLSEAEQIRQGIRWWLESREWPVRSRQREVSSPLEPPDEHRPAGSRPERKRGS